MRAVADSVVVQVSSSSATYLVRGGSIESAAKQASFFAETETAVTDSSIKVMSRAVAEDTFELPGAGIRGRITSQAPRKGGRIGNLPSPTHILAPSRMT